MFSHRGARRAARSIRCCWRCHRTSASSPPALNYKDQPENARRFLGELGNPFQAIGVDEAGRAAIDWGVYGVPETFVVGKDGKIAYKHVGPLTAESAETLLLPQIEKALAAR